MTDVREAFHTAEKALRANKLRSTLTALGIIIGVAAVIIVVSLIGGLKLSILKQIEMTGSQTLYVAPVQPNELPPEEDVKIKNRDLTLEDMRALQHALPQVSQVTPIFVAGTDLMVDGHATSTKLYMTDDTYVEQNGRTMALGRNFVPSDLRLGNKVVVLGCKLVEKLAIKGNPVGRTIRTPTLSLEIIGVLEEQGAILGHDRDNVALIPITTGMAMLSDAQRRQLIFQARIDPRISADEGADRLTEALRRIKGVKPQERAGFEVSSPKQMAAMIGNITGLISAVATGMVSIALLVGGIGIMNIMLVSVTERTREIGVRKAVGARRQDVLFQFLIESALLALLGGGLGLAFGYIAGAALSKAIFGVAGSLPLWAGLAAFGVPALIGLVFGMYPAAKASRLDPIVALRYE